MLLPRIIVLPPILGEGLEYQGVVRQGCLEELHLGKGKVVASLGNTLSREKSTSPPSLKTLMSDLLLFEKSLLKDSNSELLSLFRCGVW